jgi:acyl-CoA thioesterase
MLSPIEIVNKMMATDAFSQWLDVEILTVGEGFATLKCTIRPEMVNGFGVCHGGVTFSIADSAFAFASNTRGRHAVSIETQISHVKPVKIDDQITAVAREKHLSTRLGRYEVMLTNQNEEIVAIFNGTVFRTDNTWD